MKEDIFKDSLPYVTAHIIIKLDWLQPEAKRYITEPEKLMKALLL